MKASIIPGALLIIMAIVALVRIRMARARSRREERPCLVCGRVTPFDFCSLNCRDTYFGGEPPWDEVHDERRIM